MAVDLKCEYCEIDDEYQIIYCKLNSPYFGMCENCPFHPFD